MGIKKLIIGKANEEKSLVFDKQINIIDDLSLSKELGTENIKNEDSNLIIKSLSDTQISDVIQIKINLTSVGTFLVNFNKEIFSEDKRKTLLEELTALKDKEEPTEKSQFKKASKILEIVNKYNPEYVTYKNYGSIKVDAAEIAKQIKWDFPLLILAIPPKQPSIFERIIKSKLFSKKPNKLSKKSEEFSNKFIEFGEKYIKGDYAFTTIFTLLFTFALVTLIHEFINGQNIATFLLIMSIILIGILGYVNYNNLIAKKDTKLKFVLMVYTLIGWIIGVTVGALISNFVLTSKDLVFDLEKILWLGGGISFVVSESVVWLVFPINKLITKINK